MFFLKKRPKIVAAFAFRYDYQLIPDLLKNIEEIIDDYVFIDDRKRKDDWINETYMRTTLTQKAKDKGADWILGLDPDERFEKNAKKVIKKITRTKDKTIYGFNFRELYSENEYRIDGIWGQKKKFILFPNFPDQKFMSLRVHQQWAPINEDYKKIETGINIYHLKMIDPKNRESRKIIYNKLDPNKKIQKIGYDYITDENGMVLEKIPNNRKYYPKYDKNYNIIQFK